MSNSSYQISIFLEIKFAEQKGAKYIRGNVFFCHYRFRLSYVSDFSVEKRFYQSSEGNEVNFTDIMNISSNILAKS